MEAVELSGEARFELKRQLADTLQGRIYSAIDKKSGDWVVVKETWKQLVKLGKSRDGHSVPENFEEEKRILKYLSDQKDAHLGFVRLIDEWEDKDCYLYAMEMCRGGELFEYIKSMHSDGAVAHYTRQQSRLKQEEMSDTNEWIKVVQHMFQQIVSCTSWMHSKGVCHLDMSLENSMIGSRSKKYGNQIKIIDFGLAKYYPDNKFINNQRVGKTGYMAPEVFERKKYDPRAADIWSLGVMLFMMLIGAPPYQLPSKSNPAFNFIVNGRLRDVLKHWKRLRCINKDALDLLNKIFKYETKRITMDEILKHPFVNIENNEENKMKEKSIIKPIIKEPIIKEPILEKVEEDKQPAPDINSYTFRSEIAKKFAKQLGSNLHRDELTNIMREVEQTHNSMQQKIKESPKESPNKSLQQTIKELHLIHTNVEQRLDCFNNNNNTTTNNQQQQNKHKVEQRHVPHNN